MSRPYVPRKYNYQSYQAKYAAKAQYAPKPLYGGRAPSTYLLTKVANQAAAKGAALAVSKLAAPKKTSYFKKAHKEHHEKAHKHPHVMDHEGHRAKTHANSGIGRNIGQFAGSLIPGAGSVLGPALGWLGDKLEDGIGTLFGFGEYSVEQNSLMEGQGNVIPEGGRPPAVSNAMEHDGSSVLIRHQEPLGDIITSATPGEFKSQAFYLNPAQSKTFPWLAAMAQNFQQWKPCGMLFEFRSMAADAISGTNIALGTVTMATNYNASADLFQSKKEMQNTEYSTSTKPSLSVFHPVECSPKVTAEEVLYTRSGAVPEGDDQRLYDLGCFQIATSGFQGASVTIGELWVTYEILLIKPKAVSTTADYVLAAHLQGGSAFGASASAPFQGCALTSGSTLNAYISGGNSIKLDTVSGVQVGQRYKIDLYYATTGGANQGVFISAPTMTGLMLRNAFNNTQGTQSLNPVNGNISGVCCWSYLVEVTSVAVDPTFTVSTTNLILPSTSFTQDIYIVQVPSNFP